MVLDRPGVHWSIVLDGSEFSVLFLDEEEGRSVGAFGWLDSSSGSVLFEEGGEFSLFSLGEMDGLADEGCRGSRFEVDGVVPGPGRRQPSPLSLFEHITIVVVLKGDVVGS